MAAYWKGGFCAIIWCFFRKVIAINTVIWPKSPPSYLSHPLDSKNLFRRSFDTTFVYHLSWLPKGMIRWQQLLGFFLYQREGWDLSREGTYIHRLSLTFVRRLNSCWGLNSMWWTRSSSGGAGTRLAHTPLSCLSSRLCWSRWANWYTGW